MLKEGNPLLFSGLEVNRKKSREEVRQERVAIVAGASEEDLARLTNNQRSVLDLIFSSEGKGLTLQEIGRKEAFGVTLQAIMDARDRGIEKLERLQRGEPAIKKKGPPKLEMDSNTRELLLQNKDLSADAHRKMVSRHKTVVARWRAELGIKKNPRGHPRRKMSSKVIEDLYSNKGLSTLAIARKLRCSSGTIIDRLRIRGVEIRPRGSYQKQK